MFDRCGHITPDSCEFFSAHEGSRTARSFFPKFHHSNVAFSKVVGKGNGRVAHKPQYRIAMRFQSCVQIGGFGFLGPASFSRCFLRWREVLLALKQNSIVGLLKPCYQRFGERLLPVRSRCLGHHFQEYVQFVRPTIPIAFTYTRQFAQQMGATQRMFIAIMKIGTPAIVNKDSLEGGYHPVLLNGFAATLGMHLVKGQRWRGQGMKPLAFAIHAHARFVSMQHFFLRQLPSDCLLEASKRFVGLMLRCLNSAFTHCCAKKITAQLCQPVIRQQLIVAQIYQCCTKPRAILYRSGRFGRRVRANHTPTPCANLGGKLMLYDLKQFLGKFKDLTTFNMVDRIFLKAMTTRTVLGQVHLDGIGFGDLPKCCSGMTGLTATLTPAFAPKTLGRGLSVAIAGWRLGTVGTVHTQPYFKGGYTRHQFNNQINFLRFAQLCQFRAKFLFVWYHTTYNHCI